MLRKISIAVLFRLWKCLPLSSDHKQQIKGYLFKRLPFVLEFLQGNRKRRWHTSKGENHSKFTLDDLEINAYVPLTDAEIYNNQKVKLICFYLPQFHSIPENDAWWGKGFTEWSNVKPAQPQFVGHYQPHVPIDLSYYNLLEPGIQQRQVELAKLYGIAGFCFYFYWFGGKRLLETPIQNYLEDNSLDLPFCLCWANENWTRTWDGLENDILIAQQHSPEDDIAFIRHVVQYLHDPRYIRVDNRPLLLVYRPSSLPSAKETAHRWRQWCRDEGFGEIYLAYAQAFEKVDPADYGFDAAIEFPPINAGIPNITSQVQPLHDGFAANVYDWRALAERSNNYKKPSYTLFRGVCPAWDNTARRDHKASILANSSPCGYQQWLFNAIGETVQRFENPEQRLIFINAWNEWAEGAHLEPDERYGYAYLEATRLALVRKAAASSSQVPNNKGIIAIVLHVFYEDVFEEILAYLNKIQLTPFKLYVTTPVEKIDTVKSRLQACQFNFHLMPVNNRGRDILPFLKIMPEVIKGGHELLIKIHTKKSVHRKDGDYWRKDIFNKLLTGQAITSNINYLAKNPEVGILGPTGHIVPMSLYLGSNMYRVAQIAARLGVEINSLEKLNFVAGSMFMARTPALIPLLNIALAETDFEEEAKQVDGTLAHTLERLFSASAHSVGLKVSCPAKKVVEFYKYTTKKNRNNAYY